MIEVTFDDCHVEEFKTERDATDAILEAFAEGVLVDWVRDSETEVPYSCVWSVTLQKEK